MSEWQPQIVRLNKIDRHPNADTLEMSEVLGGYPVIFKQDQYKTGDLVAYIPVDTICPQTDQFAFLENRRIKAKKLRGIFSMGMLMPAPEGLVEGDSVVDAYQLEKWLPAADRAEYIGLANTPCEPGPVDWDFPIYTELEPLRKNKNVLTAGEEVMISEKVHGQASRFCHDGTRLWVGSHKRIKADDSRNNWWNIAKQMNLEEKFAKFPKTIFYGELYGKVQDLQYDVDGLALRIYDTFDVATMKYNDWDVTERICREIDVPIVPILFRGQWMGYDDSQHFAEGNSTLANHIREGFVVKPIKNRWSHSCGRVVLKHIGQSYLLRKEK